MQYSWREFPVQIREPWIQAEKKPPFFLVPYSLDFPAVSLFSYFTENTVNSVGQDRISILFSSLRVHGTVWYFYSLYWATQFISFTFGHVEAQKSWHLIFFFLIDKITLS